MAKAIFIVLSLILFQNKVSSQIIGQPITYFNRPVVESLMETPLQLINQGGQTILAEIPCNNQLPLSSLPFSNLPISSLPISNLPINVPFNMPLSNLPMSSFSNLPLSNLPISNILPNYPTEIPFQFASQLNSILPAPLSISDCNPAVCQSLANTIQLLVVSNLLQNKLDGAGIAAQITGPLVNELLKNPSYSCGCQNSLLPPNVISNFLSNSLATNVNGILTPVISQAPLQQRVISPSFSPNLGSNIVTGNPNFGVPNLIRIVGGGI